MQARGGACHRNEAPARSVLERGDKAYILAVVRARVLIADDSAVARLTLVREVRAAGIEVVEHESARTASAVDARDLACALLDLELGDGDGTDVASCLRSACAELPVAFFSSATEGELLVRARAIGPVFAKPQELGDAVAWVVAQTRA